MDELDFFAALDRRADTPNIRIEGVHYFSGTQRKKLDSQRKELAMLAELTQKLKTAYSFETVRVEYGPGLYFPYFNHEDHSDTLAPLRELAPDLGALAERCELTIEMGRFFASECGAYLTRVIDTKDELRHSLRVWTAGSSQSIIWAATWACAMPSIRQSSVREGEMQPWALCGSLCTTADVLVRKAELHPLDQGDILAFMNIGAYSVTEGPALFLSRDHAEHYSTRQRR